MMTIQCKTEQSTKLLFQHQIQGDKATKVATVEAVDYVVDFV